MKELEAANLEGPYASEQLEKESRAMRGEVRREVVRWTTVQSTAPMRYLVPLKRCRRMESIRSLLGLGRGPTPQQEMAK